MQSKEKNFKDRLPILTYFLQLRNAFKKNYDHRQSMIEVKRGAK